MSKIDLYALTLEEYLDVAASRSPTPGGGSVSAVCGANAAAMVLMVANLTLGKKGYESCQAVVKRIQSEAAEQMAALKRATADDMASFDAFMAAWRLPADTEADRAAKRGAQEQAARAACQPPLAIGRACLAILALARDLAPLGNKSAISDVGVAIYIAEAALRAALLSVEINLPHIHTAATAAQIRSEGARLLAEAEGQRLAGLDSVRSRLPDGL
jgi:formiminotetrahydrofolate cyclodeaminase